MLSPVSDQSQLCRQVLVGVSLQLRSCGSRFLYTNLLAVALTCSHYLALLACWVLVVLAPFVTLARSCRFAELFAQCAISSRGVE